MLTSEGGLDIGPLACCDVSETNGIVEGTGVAPDSLHAQTQMAARQITQSTQVVDTNGSRALPEVIDLTESSYEGNHTERDVCDDHPESQNAPMPAIGRGKTRHPFFALQATRKDKRTDTVSSTAPRTGHMHVPWPSADEQHNAGSQTSFSCAAPAFGKRRKTRVESTNESSLGWLKVKGPGLTVSTVMEPHELTPEEREEVISSLPEAHRDHPGIARLLKEVPMNDEGEMWSQRWRPRRAAEVVGNEENALYLKAWLEALALRGERPRVVREVVKKRGRKRHRLESDDESSAGEWIADDEESSGSGAGDLDEGFPTLTNTILLAGPPGSGKSSSIYACAEELGWEVFEVYPGVGRRSGGNISSLIGDVGKNHHVGKRRVGCPPG